MARLLTKEGLKKLQDELLERTTDLRQKIAQEIKEAKEQGDLSENAEYSEAKDQQTENESRIAELEMMIKDAEVVERDASDSTVQIGSHITVKVKGDTMEFDMVGANEADPGAKKISHESPIGKALLGHEKGEKVKVETPNGNVMYEIVKVG